MASSEFVHCMEAWMPGWPQGTRLRAPTSIRQARSAERLEEGLYPGLRSAENQGMNVVRAFIGVHHLEIHDVPNDAIFIGDAVAAQHVARKARNLQRLAAGISLHDGSNFH